MAMEVLYERCAGLDVHKKTVTACLITPGPGGKAKKEKRTFGTMTRELMALADWLLTHGCTHVAMESTGVYWKPVYNILEGICEVILVNAQHVKNVPGRKTDVSDAEWLADLLRHGLLRGSFIPPKPIRELRELVRYRTSLVRERSAAVNRLQKVLEGANIKLASVATDIMGKSGRAMLEAIASGCQDAETMAQLARGKLRAKLAQLRAALEGLAQPHHRLIIAEELAHIDYLDEAIERVSQEIEERMRPFAEQARLLCEITGVERKTSEALIAEIGLDMSRFPTAKHAAAWAGVCPGNNESAGKKKAGRARKGNRWLEAALVEAARAAARTRGTYLSALYHRLAARRGSNRAALAVAHAILVIAYSLLKNGGHYQDLGHDYFDRLDRHATSRRLVKRLETLGFQVTLKDLEEVA